MASIVWGLLRAEGQNAVMSDPLPELASSCRAALMLLLGSSKSAERCRAACFARVRGWAFSLAGEGPHWGRPMGGLAACCQLCRLAVGEVKDACSAEAGTLQVRGQSVEDQDCSATVRRTGAPA